MSRRCEICGKTSSVGNTITRSGSPKYKGGIGLHTGGITKRRFYPNIQKIKILHEGRVLRVRVCSRCLKAGKVQRPPARPTQIKRSVEAEARRVAEEAAEAARHALAEAEAMKEAEAAEAEAEAPPSAPKPARTKDKAEETSKTPTKKPSR